MISEFYTRNFGFLFENQSYQQSLYRLKNQCLKHVKLSPQNKTFNDEHHQQLESLFTLYVINQLDIQFDSASNDSSQLIDIFSAPAKRMDLLKALPLKLQHCLLFSRVSESNSECANRLNLSDSVKHKFLMRVNYPPFSANHAAIVSFTQAQHLLTRTQFNIACCASLIEDAVYNDSTNPIDTMIFQEGINLAYIASLIADDKHIDPLRVFLTAMMRSISLLFIHTMLQQSGKLHSKGELLNDIQILLPRLDYWLAKDLGLPDDILHSLKYRLKHNDFTCEVVNILHTAEQCQLSILLFKQSIISTKEIQKILQLQGVSHLNLMHRLQFTQH
jgi:hypothetical protein